MRDGSKLVLQINGSEWELVASSDADPASERDRFESLANPGNPFYVQVMIGGESVSLGIDPGGITTWTVYEQSKGKKGSEVW